MRHPFRTLAVPLAALLLLAGCAVDEGPPDEVVQALADTRPIDWSPGNYWAYQATFEENVTFDVALVVHDAGPDGFRLGSNLSAGFFGLPFTGNVSPDLNPRIGPEEWPLYQFPLADGKAWEYTLFGYEAKTVARAALVDVPGLGIVPGFRMESSAYAQTFARYDYVPQVGWFTRLELIEPTNGQRVLDVKLRAYGPDYGSAYYVEKTIREVRLDYPTSVPGAIAIDVPDGFVTVRAFLTVETSAGAASGEIKDATTGKSLAKAQAIGKGAQAGRISLRPRAALEWTLDHAGAGTGVVHLEITGLTATGPLAQPSQPQMQPIDLVSLLQSTRPALPQVGQVTSTALPVAV